MRGSTKWVLCTSRPRMWVISARNLQYHIERSKLKIDGSPLNTTSGKIAHFRLSISSAPSHEPKKQSPSPGVLSQSQAYLSSLRNDRDFVTGGGGGHLDVGGERVSGEDLTVLVEAPLLPRCPHLDLVVKDERPQRGPLPRFRRRAAATRGGIR